MKFCARCGEEIDTRDGENLCAACDGMAADGIRKSRARALRRARHDALTSLGLTRVRGACGGVYYE